MNKVKEVLKNKIEYFGDENISMDEKNFYLVMSASIPVFLILSLVFLFRKSDLITVIYSLIMALFMACITYIANSYHQEKIYGTVFCIILNFLIIPLFFFASGDIFNGVTIFFTLSIIVTVFLHTKSRILYPLILAELLSDIFCIIFVFNNKKLFEGARTLANSRNTVTSCFEIVAISATFMCLYQTYIYNIAKKRLNEANRDISIAESSKTRFLSNMTHEIRTPMNAIIGMTSLILKENLDDDTRYQVNVVKNASTDLLRIINGILEFSKFDSGKVNLINTKYSFSALISDIIDKISKEYAKDNINFNAFVSSNIPNELFGDDIRIKQVFNYILFSSLSRSIYGQVYIDILGNIDEVSKTVEIECKISSTGNGFSSAELKSMFNAYSDYDSRQKSSYKGMGLELNICKAILELMGGTMEVQSIEGIGTSISFSFINYIIDKTPIAKIKDAESVKPLVYETISQHEYPWQKLFADFSISASYARNVLMLNTSLENTRFSHIFLDAHDYDEVKDVLQLYDCENITYIITDQNHIFGDFGECKILRAPLYSINIMEAINGTWTDNKYAKEKEKEIVTYPGARVLIVDDSVINLKVIESLLSNYDIIPRMAQSGYEALDILKREEMQLVLLDQKMPEFDGIDTIHALRESNTLNNNTPVICVTAEFGADTKNKLINEGFNDYLAKPINLIYFDKILKSYLPENLRTVIKDNKENKDISENDNDKKNAIPDIDNSSPVFDPNIGIANLAGNKEAYLVVLSEYYKEGKEKLELVPREFAEGDISLYTTNVHALKSSSATVGAMQISPLFKALEFAGKDNDLSFIKDNTESTFKMFEEVLDIVKEYLISENAYVDDDSSFDEQFDDSDAQEVDIDDLNDLLNSIISMNLRHAEEIVDKLSAVNYGSAMNKKIKDIKNSIDGFEYMEAKSIIETIIG